MRMLGSHDRDVGEEAIRAQESIARLERQERAARDSIRRAEQALREREELDRKINREGPP
jgi:hypothetical protein